MIGSFSGTIETDVSSSAFTGLMDESFSSPAVIYAPLLLI